MLIFTIVFTHSFLMYSWQSKAFLKGIKVFNEKTKKIQKA